MNSIRKYLLFFVLSWVVSCSGNPGKIACTKTPLKCTLTYSTKLSTDTALTVNIDFINDKNAVNILYFFMESDEGKSPSLLIDEFVLDGAIETAKNENVFESEFDCYPSSNANQRLSRQSSLETGNPGISLGSKTAIFTTTCGTIKTKTLQEIKACGAPLKTKNSVFQIEKASHVVTFAFTFASTCNGANGPFLLASTVAAMPFHIVRCKFNQLEPFLSINNDLYQNEFPINAKEVSQGANAPIIDLTTSPIYFAGLTCLSASVGVYKMNGEDYQKVLEDYMHQTTVQVTIPDLSKLSFGVGEMKAEDVDVPYLKYKDMSDAIKLTKKRMLSLIN